MGELHHISLLQAANPDALLIAAGDFNQAALKSLLPKFHQHVKCATRANNTLDYVYTNIRNSYREATREAATKDGVTKLQEYTDSVLGYIRKCIQDMTVLQTIRRRAHQKLRLTGEVCSPLRAQNAAGTGKTNLSRASGRRSTTATSWTRKTHCSCGEVSIQPLTAKPPPGRQATQTPRHQTHSMTFMHALR